MSTYIAPTLTNVSSHLNREACLGASEKILTIEEAREKLAELQKGSKEYITLQNALIKTLGITNISLKGVNYKVYNWPTTEKMLGGFGTAEHVQIGKVTKLEGLTENAPLLVVAGKINLRFEDIIALSGDFYGVPNQPISLPGGNDEAKESRFMAAFDTLENADPAELREVLNAIEHECLQITNSVLPHHCYSSQLMDSAVRLTAAKKDYQALLEDNSDHFSSQAAEVYKIGHRIALNSAQNSGKTKDTERLARSYAIEAFACHFLSDLFASGHVRNQRGDLENFLVKQLQFKEKRAKPLSAILTAAQHEKDGRTGVSVSNRRGNLWRSYGDGYFFNPQSEENQQRVLEAVLNSVKEVYNAYRNGETTSHMDTWLPEPTGENFPPLYNIKDNCLFLHDETREIKIISKLDYMRKSIPLALSQLPESYITGFIKSKISLAPPIIVSKVIFPILNEFTDIVWKGIGIASQAQVHLVSENINSKLDDMAELLKASYKISMQILTITNEVLSRLEIVEIKQKWISEYGEIREAVASIMDMIHASSTNINYNANFQKYADKMEGAYLRLSRVINEGTSSQTNLIKTYKELMTTDNSKNAGMVTTAVTMWFRWLLDLQTRAFGVFIAGKIANQEANVDTIESMKADFEKNIEMQIKKHIEEINISLIGKPLSYICIQYTNAKIKQVAFQ